MFIGSKYIEIIYLAVAYPIAGFTVSHFADKAFYMVGCFFRLVNIGLAFYQGAT
jgi:hypothetical protein